MEIIKSKVRNQRRKGKRLNPGIRGKRKGRNSTRTGRTQKRKGRGKNKEKTRREKKSGVSYPYHVQARRWERLDY